jgi:peptidyl-prolyl cis-trans isomerase SurA
VFKFSYLCATIALLAAPVASAEELSETGEFLDGVAAIVNEGVVLKSQLRVELDRIIKRANEGGFQLPPATVLQEQVLERLIVAEIQMQRADQIGLVVSDQMLNEAIERMASQAGIPFDQMPAALAADGIDYADFRSGMRDEITLEQLRRIMVAQNIEVSDREVAQCITDLEDNVVVNSGWNLSHILINLPEGATATQIEETRLARKRALKHRQFTSRSLAVRISVKWRFAIPKAIHLCAVAHLAGSKVSKYHPSSSTYLRT